MKPSRPNSDAERVADDWAAAFADRVIEGNTGQQAAQHAGTPGTTQDAQESMGEVEMAQMEETIYRFKTAVKAAQPNPAAAARIEKRVMAVLKESAPSRWETWRNVLLGSTGLQYTLAVAMLAILLAAGLLLKPVAGDLTGAALEIPLWTPLLLAAVCIVVIFIIRKDRS